MNRTPEQALVMATCDQAADAPDALVLLDALGLIATAEGLARGVRGHRRGCSCSSCRSTRTRNKARLRAVADPSIIIHGQENSYQYYNCRCRSCKTAHADYARQRYQKQLSVAS